MPQNGVDALLHIGHRALYPDEGCPRATVQATATAARRPGSAASERPRCASASRTTARPSSSGTRRSAALARLSAKLIRLPSSATFEPPSRVTVMRLVRAQREAQQVACALAAAQRPVAPDEFLDRFSATCAGPGVPTCLLEQVHSVSGVLGGTSTTLDPERFGASGERCRSLFSTWCAAALKSAQEVRYVTVWAQALHHQLRQQAATVPPSNPYRGLATLLLLLRTLDGVIPLPSRHLVFELLDDLMSVIVDGWRTISHQEEERQQQQKDRRASCRADCAAATTPATTETAVEVMIRSSSYAATLTAAPLFAESVEAARTAAAEERRQWEEASRRQADTEAKRREITLREAKESRRTYLRFALRAWHGLTRQSRSRRTMSHGVVNQMARQHRRTQARAAFLALKLNCADARWRRLQASHDTNVREFRAYEAASLQRVSGLLAQLAEERAEAARAAAEAQDAREREMAKVLADTREMRDSYQSKLDAIATLTRERHELSGVAGRWASAASSLLSEAIGVHGGAHDGEVAPAMPRRASPGEQLLRLGGAAGLSVAEQCLPRYRTLQQVLDTRAASQRVLLLFAAALVRPHCPGHPPIENFGSDLSDSVAYLCILHTLFPALFSRRALDAALSMGLAQRADTVCAVLESADMPGLIAPTDIVLGAAVRGLALLAHLFILFSAPRAKNEVQRENDPLPPPPPPLSDIVAVKPFEEAATATIAANRAWGALAQLVSWDTVRGLQSIRSVDGEILDERGRRFADFFVRLDEAKLSSLLSAPEVAAGSAGNEADRVEAVLRGSFSELRGVYVAYAVGGGTVVMTQQELAQLARDAVGLLRGLPRGALEAAYRFATQRGGDAATGMVFAPSAAGAAKRALTPAMAAAPVTPKVFVHLLLHLAAQRLALRQRRGPRTPPPDATPQPSPPSLSAALRALIAEELLPGAASDSFGEFRRAAHHPLVARQFRPHSRALQRAFRLYGVPAGAAAAANTSLLSRKPGNNDAPESARLSADEFGRLLRDLRLLDAKCTAEEVSGIFRRLVFVDEARLQDLAEAAEAPETGAVPGIEPGLTFEDFLDGLCGVAAVRYALPGVPVHIRVQYLLRDPFPARLKEVTK